MAATATIAFRVKPEIKKRADELFARLGMTTSTGMNVLLMQTLDHRGFAAPVALGDDDPDSTDRIRTDEEEENEYPNAETRAVLDRYLAGEEPTYGPFNSVKEMLDAAESMEV